MFIKKIITYLIKSIELIFIIFTCSYELQKPKKKKFLLFHKSSEIVLNFGVNKEQTNTIDKKKINLYVLFFTIIDFQFSYRSYIEKYLAKTTPKIMVNYVDNDPIFYLLKKNFPKIVFISIQNGIRDIRDDFYLSLDALNKKNIRPTIDYYFVLNKYFAQELKRYINFKPMICGSFKNNSVKLSKIKRYKKNSLLFISQFDYKTIDTEDFYWESERKILPYIEEYSQKNDLELCILGRTKNIKEKIFYESILSNKFKFIFSSKFSLSSYKKNYQKLDNYENIIFIDSTLGYESVTRNKKIIVFSGRKTASGIKNSFCWPKKIRTEGSFYTHKNDKRTIFRLLDENIKTPYKQWYKNSLSDFKYLCEYDLNNKKFLDLVNSIK